MMHRTNCHTKSTFPLKGIWGMPRIYFVLQSEADPLFKMEGHRASWQTRLEPFEEAQILARELFFSRDVSTSIQVRRGARVVERYKYIET